MYNCEYEVDVLLFLRLAKFLHSQDPDTLESILMEYVEFDLPSLAEVCESIIWEICTQVFFDEDAEREIAFCTFSHPFLKRFNELGEKWSRISGQSDGPWRLKFSDIAEYYLLGTNYSVYQLQCYPADSRLKTWFSPDCYDPIEFGNSLVDMLLCFQRENERLEGLLKEAEQRKEAA